MRKLSKTSLLELSRELSIISKEEQCTYIGGGNGSMLDPYTFEEFDYMCISGIWNGGYVEGYGYVDSTLNTQESYLSNGVSGVFASFRHSARM